MQPNALTEAGRSGVVVLDHLLVGIDETPESLVAAAQAGVLRPPGGRLVLLAATEGYLAAHAGLAAPHALERLAAGTMEELERAQALVDADETIVASGPLVDLLRGECARRGATLVVVGARPHRRFAALAFGGHDVDALHDLRCSVLIARPGWGPAKPDRVVVAVDGSPASRAAEGVARALAKRLGCPVAPIVPLDDPVDPALLRDERSDALLEPGSLVAAVVAASTDSSLVVIARSDERRRWGGTLVERAVYAARCSVLVFQPDATTR
jgi:nucleotide-binding universal stress UspA family protein